jgi:protein-L-isoaspartate O-methyltransferase
VTQEKLNRPPLEALLAVALVSFSILAAEVALTRIFSVLFRAPYVFLIISGAIGGLGLGGLLVQAVRPTERSLRAWVVGLTLVFALALAAPVLVLFVSPWGRGLVARAELPLVVLLPMITFTVAGTVLSLLFRRYAESGGFLYFVDLAAAAIAAPATVLLLDRLGGINTPLALACGVAVTALVLAVRAGARWVFAAAALLAGLAAAFGSNLAKPWIDIPMLTRPASADTDPQQAWQQKTKPLFAELADPRSTGKIVRTDWTAVSRTDVVQEGPDAFYIYTDGDVPTQMMPWDGTLDSARREYGGFIGSLPYRLARARIRRVMAIGAGGGLDVLLAKAGGATEIDAVEINPSIPSIVRDPRFARTYAKVYADPQVRLVVDEGRSFLQRRGKYDLIYFACAKTATTQTSGVALLDNHLYTIEAFRDYWKRLTDEGLVALVTQEHFLIDRLLVTAVAALQREGIAPDQARKHLVTARVQPERFAEGPYRHVLIMSRRPWENGEMAQVGEVIRAGGLEPMHLPHIQPLGAGGSEIPAGADLAAMRDTLERQYPIPGSGTFANLSPVTDDSPFYVDIAHGLHPTLAQLLTGSIIATVIVLCIVTGFGLSRRRSSPEDEADEAPVRAGPLASWCLYFAALGAGFMLVELSLMQRFILLLGFPTRSLTITLAALLVSSALGSMLTQKGAARSAAVRLTRLLPVLVVLLLAYLFLLPPLIDALLPLPLWARATGAAALLFPAGFLMGMPFPTALRTLEGGYRQLIPGFWSVNGVTSILGSVATMAIAKFTGYTGALLMGAACYLLAWGIAVGSLARTRAADSTATAVSPK